jgi:hypothetical protein
MCSELKFCKTLFLYLFLFVLKYGPGVAQWLKHYATSRKVPGSTPDGVTGEMFVASDNFMCPGSTQPLKMSTRILLGVKTVGAYG